MVHLFAFFQTQYGSISFILHLNGIRIYFWNCKQKNINSSIKPLTSIIRNSTDYFIRPLDATKSLVTYFIQRKWNTPYLTSFWYFIKCVIYVIFNSENNSRLIFCSFLFFLVFFRHFWPTHNFYSIHIVFGISYFKDPERHLKLRLRWSRYQAKSVHGIRWSADFIRRWDRIT